MSSRRCFFLTVALLTSAVFTSTTSHGQELSTLDATQLFTQMTLAMQQAESVHIQVHQANLPPEPQQVVQDRVAGFVDISSKQRLLHAVFTTTYSDVQTHAVIRRERSTFIAVDGRSAQGGSSGGWYCQTISRRDESHVYALTAFAHLPATPHFIGGVTSATVLGVAVWRVRIELGNGTDVLTIAQNTHRLVRIKEVMGVGDANSVTKTFSDFSRYGESVAAHLPLICR